MGSGLCHEVGPSVLIYIYKNRLRTYDFWERFAQLPKLYGGQQWTALCLVRAEQRQVVSGVLDNFYLEPILKFTQCDSKELQGGRSTLKT